MSVREADPMQVQNWSDTGPTPVRCQTAKHGILDEISLVRDHSDWCGFGADYGILVRCGAVFTWCGAD